MSPARTGMVATGIVVATGLLWGLYWLPVRALAERGVPGAWGTVAITLAAALVLWPVVRVRRGRAPRADGAAPFSVALGGAAFALYSIGLVYGRVAIIILLYFLTPVWSTLIARLVLGWPISRTRLGAIALGLAGLALMLGAIALGLAGLALMLGADGEVPLPRGTGEWMALAAGVLWSVATTGMRVRPSLAPPEAAFVFALGALAAALALAPLLVPWPGAGAGGGVPLDAATLGLAVATGALWWGLSTAALIWAAGRLEPARVGILLMSEVLVGAASAALIAGERLAVPELAGGALVLAAGVLEVRPERARRGAGGP